MDLRIGVVRYLNARPLIEGIDKLPGLALLPAAPAAVAPLLHTRQADIALASIVDAVARPEHPLAIIPAGAIGSAGPTRTVRLYSTVPLAEAGTLVADPESHTSVALARLILRERFGVDPRLIPRPDTPPDTPPASPTPTQSPTPATPTTPLTPEPHALLLIGDKVITDPPSPAAYPHQLDLGEAWHTWTNQPLVYAAWMCRPDDADDPRIALAAALLDRQRRHNLTRIGWIAQHRAPEHGWPPPLALDYLARIMRYDLGPREQAAAANFIDRLRASGLLHNAATLRWLHSPAAA